MTKENAYVLIISILIQLKQAPNERNPSLVMPFCKTGSSLSLAQVVNYNLPSTHWHIIFFVCWWGAGVTGNHDLLQV